MKKSDMIKCIGILVVICLVISGALAVVNSFTKPVIDSAKAERENQSRQMVLSAATSFEPVEASGMPATIQSAYKGLDASGNVVGYVFTAGGKGFDGTIVVMAAIGTDGKIVQVATIDVTSETKTLGGQTANASYTEQYTGADSGLAGVNAISGATITSTAYKNCVKDCFAAFDVIKEG